MIGRRRLTVKRSRLRDRYFFVVLRASHASNSNQAQTIHDDVVMTKTEKFEVARPLLFCRFARLPRLEFELKIHSNVCMGDFSGRSSIVNITHFN
jgi:hypothetical protein